MGQPLEDNFRRGTIVGVFNNINSTSIINQVKPLLFTPYASFYKTLHIRLKSNVTGSVWKTGLTEIEKQWKTFYPGMVFKFSFLEESIEKLYEKEQQLGLLLKCATAFLILISLIGLTGLVFFLSDNRKKEIGVRKVLGASVMQIIVLITKNFVLQIAFAFLIAIPIAWITIGKWLQGFAYRINLSGWIVLKTGLLITAISLFVLILQTWKFAISNPTKSLRSGD